MTTPATPYTYEINFDTVGPWHRDETQQFPGITTAEELEAAVRKWAKDKIVVRTPRVTVDLEAGVVKLDGGHTGTGTIKTAWPVPTRNCGMGMTRPPAEPQ